MSRIAHVIPVLLGAVAIVSAPRPAEACTLAYTPMLEKIEVKPTVSLVHVMTASQRGRATLRVVTSIKGTSQRELKPRVGDQCAAQFRRGDALLVVASADGSINYGDVYRLEGKSAGAIAKWLTSYLAAADSARTSLLVDAITAGKPIPSAEASAHLERQPHLLALLSSADRQRLRDTLRKPHAPSALPMIVARVGDVQAIPSLIALLKNPNSDLAGSAATALTLLTLHDEPSVKGDTLPSPAAWTAWMATGTRKALTAHELLANAFRTMEGHTVRFGTVDERGDLADIVANGKFWLTRLAAANRCELLTGRRLDPSGDWSYELARLGTRYAVHEVRPEDSWGQLAKACRQP